MEAAYKPTTIQAILGIAIVPFNAIMFAFTIATLWAWFVAPLGVPAISMWHASGLSIFVSLFAKIKRPESKSLTRAEFSALLSQAYSESIANVVVSIAMGYVAHRMM